MVGGTAVVHYVKNERELTPDLDFLVNDITTVKDLLYSGNKKFKPLDTGIGTNLGIVANELNCDYLDVSKGNQKMNKLILETYNTVKIGGYQVKIIKPELLAILKFDLSRNRDQDDAFALLHTANCNREAYIKYANQLKDSLQDYDSICNYQELIL